MMRMLHAIITMANISATVTKTATSAVMAARAAITAVIKEGKAPWHKAGGALSITADIQLHAEDAFNHSRKRAIIGI